MDAHTIKKALVNYKKNIELVERLTWKLEEMSTKLYEGGTSSIIKIPEGTPQDRSCLISDFVVKEHEMQNEIALLSQEIEIADKFLENVNKRKDIFVDKFIYGLSYSEMCEKHRYSKTRIFAMIKEEIDDQSDF